MKRKIFFLVCCMISCMVSAADNLQQLKARVDPVLARVEKQPDWLYSRLQMYWSLAESSRGHIINATGMICFIIILCFIILRITDR